MVGEILKSYKSHLKDIDVRFTMSSVKPLRYGLILMLPKTRHDTRTRQLILDFIRGFLSNIDALRESKVTMKKRIIEVEDKRYDLLFDSEGEFNIGIALEEEESLGALNAVVNDICTRLNAQNWKEAKSKIRAYSFLEHSIEGKIDILSKLVRDETLKTLADGSTQSFEPRRILVSSKKNDTTIAVSITVGKKENIVETSLVHMYKDEFPPDVVTKTYEQLKEWQNRVSVKLISEGNGTR